MKFPCSIHQGRDGRWTARHSSPDLGDIAVTAATRDEALAKITGELRYRLELCPCSGDSYQHLEIELLTTAPPR
jgi:hypothetical protein